MWKWTEIDTARVPRISTEKMPYLGYAQRPDACRALENATVAAPDGAVLDKLYNDKIARGERP